MKGTESDKDKLVTLSKQYDS
ncbi:unnamed protein product, partial [Rotaria sp. Silwood1]